MNLYPVKTAIDGRIVRNLRLSSGPRGVVVWELDKATGQVEELVRTGEPAERVGATQSWSVGELVFEPQRGCGCNHPMYRWTPPVESGVGAP